MSQIPPPDPSRLPPPYPGPLPAYPPPPGGTFYPSYAPRPQNNGRGGVIALGVVGIILGCLCGFTTAKATLDLQQSNPVFDAMRHDPVVHNLTLSLAIAGVGLQLILIVGSIGTLLVQRWGRALMLLFAVGMIAQVLTDIVTSAMLVLPLVNSVVAAHGGNTSAPEYQGRMIGVLIGTGFRAVFPIVVLVVLNRPQIKALFRNELQPAY
jgi:hypothetical protein